MMPNKLARTIIRNPAQIPQPGKAHRLLTRNLDNIRAIRIKVVANIQRKCPLLMAPLVSPPPTTFIPLLRRTLGPRLEHLERIRQILRDDDAGILFHVSFVVDADVVVAAEDLAHVEGHGDGGVGADGPPVEHPFEGHFEVREGGVGVDEDDELVVREEGGEDVGFYPGGVHVFAEGGVEETWEWKVSGMLGGGRECVGGEVLGGLLRGRAKGLRGGQEVQNGCIWVLGMKNRVHQGYLLCDENTYCMYVSHTVVVRAFSAAAYR